MCQNIQPALKYSTLLVWNEGHLSVTLLWLWSRFPTPWMEIRNSRWVRSRAKTLKIIEGFLSKYSAISVTFNSLSIWNKGDLSGTFNWLLEGIPDSMNEDHELKMGLESSPRPWDSFKKGIISKYLNSSETLNNLSLWNKGYQSETFPSLWMIFLTPWGDIRNSKMGLEKSQKH